VLQRHHLAKGGKLTLPTPKGQGPPLDGEKLIKMKGFYENLRKPLGKKPKATQPTGEAETTQGEEPKRETMQSSTTE
jgi:hypothetical protein